MGQPSRSSLRGWQVWAISFAIATALLLAFFTRNPQLYDNDAYYHLAIGRAYWQEGLIDDLRWTRFSAMHDGFGDKEVLFHLLLAPFAGLARDPVRGGQVALTLVLAALFATLAASARRALGNWAILLPWWLAFSSTELAWRWVRLRPELLSLLLFLCALEAIARRRYLLLGVIAALYALSYTAFHAFLGVCILIFLFAALARRRREWSLPAYATAGVGVGLLVHPHFPKNLEIWALQTFEFFRYRSVLDVGSEITPNYTDVTLMVNLGWALGLVVLWLSSRPRTAAPTADAIVIADDLDHRLTDAYGVAAVAFTLLYLLMSRFAIYAIPFLTLWMLDGLRASGREIGGRTRLPWSRAQQAKREARAQVPAVLAAALVLAVSAPEALRQWRNYDLRTQAGPGDIRLRDREAFSQALPAGAKVAAPWQQTSIYMLWAPQALYLNALDPVFLAALDPSRHDAQAAVFSGEEPDVPLAVAGALDSEYLAYSPYAGLDLLTARLEHDPRAALRHKLHGFNLLWQISPDRNQTFILDWIEPQREAQSAARPYPRLPAPGSRFEAYVDTRRLDSTAGCLTLAHRMAVDEPARRTFELAPWGPSTVSIDGRSVAGIGGEPNAVLGNGVIFPLDLTAGDHVLAVRTCPGKDEKGPRGFYLRRLD